MTHREFTTVEMMTCAAARLFEDDKAYFIGFGMPQIAAVLAQKLYAPHIIWIYEYGTIAPCVRRPLRTSSNDISWQWVIVTWLDSQLSLR
jgi:glutaconate CoA-transferase subunit B